MVIRSFSVESFEVFLEKKLIQVEARKPARLCQAVWNLNGAQRIRNTVGWFKYPGSTHQLRERSLKFHYLRRAFYMPGGWPWDFGHQQYKSESETNLEPK